MMKAGMIFKSIIVTAAITIPGVMLTGCGERQVKISIEDGFVETNLSAPEGMTVGELLNMAELQVGDKDKITPGLNDIVTSDNSQIKIERYASVRVNVEDEEETSVELVGGTVEDALDSARIVLSEHDYVNHQPDAYLSNGMDIVITRRLVVKLTADGKTEDVLTQAKTVEELLKEQKLELNDMDRITPRLTDSLKEGTKVTVKRVEKKELVEKEPVEFETETTYSNSMTVGTSKITQQGVNGEKEVTYEVTYVDGREESREAKSETVIKEAVNQKVVMGSKPQGKTVISKQAIYDCDGSGHGYYIIKYSDGSVEYKDF